MTENDKQLIAKAESYSRYEWHFINDLIPLADTEECRQILRDIRFDLRDLAFETY